MLNLYREDLFKKSFFKDRITNANDLKVTNNTVCEGLVIKVKVSVSKRLTDYYLRNGFTKLL